MKSALFSISLFSLIFTLSACVTTRSELNGKRQQGEVAEEDSRPNSSVKSEDLNASEPAVIEQKTESATASTPRPSPLVPVNPQPTSQYGMEEMRAELAKLSGKVEEMEQDKKNQQAAQAEEQAKLQAKIAELEKQLKEKEEQEKGPVVPEGKTPFQAGKEAFFSNNYETAIQFFDAFLKDHEKGKEVDTIALDRLREFFSEISSLQKNQPAAT